LNKKGLIDEEDSYLDLLEAETFRRTTFEVLVKILVDIVED
jgi:hypothetical protein